MVVCLSSQMFPLDALNSTLFHSELFQPEMALPTGEAGAIPLVGVMRRW